MFDLFFNLSIFLLIMWLIIDSNSITDRAMKIIYKLAEMSKEAVLYMCFHGQTEENHDTLQSGLPFCEPGHKSATY